VAKLGAEDHKRTLRAWQTAEFSEHKGGDHLDPPVGRETFRSRMRGAKTWLKTPEGKAWGAKHDLFTASKPEIQVRHLTEQLKQAAAKIALIERDNLRAEHVRQYIFGLTEHQPAAPPWINDRKNFKYNHGVPSLFLSDLHYGETVNPAQVFQSNKFNANIAIERVKRTIDTTEHLTFGILKDPVFPGIVLILGGDNINGVLRDEALANNDRQIMSQAIEVADLLHSSILKLIRIYGRVMVFGVPGNHGRNTRKPWASFYAETNFDWLVYCMLERFFKQEIAAGKVAFKTPPARDITFKIAGRAFRLTHGDQFRGGDSIIGPLGPIIRGNNKKQAMALSLPTEDEEYQTLLVAHFHSLYMTPKLIINGSIKGYDEYAMSCNFGWEPPQQALFFTHEKYGVNHYMPVLADEPKVVAKQPWVEYRTGPQLINNHSAWVGE
jgi:hypothetical protein